MAKNISILGASYSDVPAVTLPTTQGGTASFTDITDTTATNDDVVEGKVFYSAGGVRSIGTGISRNQVQTLVEENKVKHVYGIDGYANQSSTITIYRGEFRKFEALIYYDSELTTPADASYFANLCQQLNLLEIGSKGTFVVNNITFTGMLVQDDGMTGILFSVENNPIVAIALGDGAVGFMCVTDEAKNYITNPLEIHSTVKAPNSNLSTDPIETFYFDQEFKVYSLENDNPVYWDQAKLEEFKAEVGKNPVKIDDTQYMVLNNSSTIVFSDISSNTFTLQYNSGVIITFDGVSIINPVVVYPSSLCSVIENHADNIASGICSHAEGFFTTASGNFSHAEGYFTTASGHNSHTEGKQTAASSFSAHAEGLLTTASNDYAHAEGCLTTASGVQSHAEGYSTTASGIQSHAEGYFTTASGFSSHAEGDSSTASGKVAHAEGDYTIAASRAQHVFGQYNVQDAASNPDQRGTYVEIIGNGTDDNKRSNARTLDWSGNERLAGSITLGVGTSNEVTLTAESLWTIMDRCGLISHDE